MQKILVVDDTNHIRMQVAHMVESLGHTVILATDGIMALSVLKANPGIAAVISDCQMPNLDGPSLAKEIRGTHNAIIPVFLYSSYMRVNDVSHLLKLGITSFLGYPITRDILSDYLGRYLPMPVT